VEVCLPVDVPSEHTIEHDSVKVKVRVYYIVLLLKDKVVNIVY